jgi:hypothetical protein
MGEHRSNPGGKGEAYKITQCVEPQRRRYVRQVHLTEAWLLRHGFVKKEELNVQNRP